MVKRFHISLIFVLATLVCFAGEKSATFHEGIQAFKKKEYTSAITLFEKEIKANPENATAYFNLGLSYNAEKNFGKAIWSFERVLKLTPNDAEAIDNIEQNYVELDNGQKWSTDLSRFQRVLFSMSSNFWAYLSIGFSVFSALLLIMFRKASSVSRKRFFIVGAGLSIILMVFSIYTASGTYNYEHSNDYAIVTQDKIDTFKSGSATKEEKTGIQLDAGTKVKIIETYKGSKRKVETDDGVSHFVDQSQIEVI